MKNRYGGSAVSGAAVGEDGDDPRHSISSTGTRARDFFNMHVDRRGYQSKMAEIQRAPMKASKGQLKVFYDDTKSADAADFT